MGRGSSTEGTAPGIPVVADDRAGQRIDLVPIRTLLSRIVQRWNPEKIWLFGSRARGNATPSSDWDLLVVVPDTTPPSDLDPMVVWDVRRGLGIGSDVIVVTRSQFDEDRDTTNTIEYEADHFGVLVYER